MQVGLVIVLIGLLIFLAQIFSALFEKTRIPDVLPLMVIGLLLGPIFGYVLPSDFGKVGNIFTVATLIIILFDGGLSLTFKSLRKSLRQGVLLVVISFTISVATTAAALHYLVNMPLMGGLMLGAILGGTCSDVVVPLVDKMNLQDKPRTALLLEATLSDVLCIIVTIGLIRAEKLGGVDLQEMAITTGLTLLVSIGFGVAAAFLWAPILKSTRHMKNATLTTLAFAFLLYGGMEYFSYSGGIAVLTLGIVLNNVHSLPLSFVRRMDRDGELNVSEKEKFVLAEMVFLLKTFFYVYVGLSLKITSAGTLVAAGLLTMIALVFRIPVVWMALDRGVKKKDATVAAILVPRGLAAAVLASMLIQEGFWYGQIVQDIVYASVLVSVIVTSVMAFVVGVGLVEEPYSSVFSKFGPRWQ